MKSKEMFKVLLDRFADVAYSAGIVETEARAEVANASDDAHDSFYRGSASRDDEVAELKKAVAELTNDVRRLVDERSELEQKLREKQFSSFNSGVAWGRGEAVTQEAVAAIKSVVERTVIAANVMGVR